MAKFVAGCILTLLPPLWSITDLQKLASTHHSREIVGIRTPLQMVKFIDCQSLRSRRKSTPPVANLLLIRFLRCTSFIGASKSRIGASSLMLLCISPCLRWDEAIPPVLPAFLGFVINVLDVALVGEDDLDFSVIPLSGIINVSFNFRGDFSLI